MNRIILDSTPLYAVLDKPSKQIDQVILFLHGWTGDENSMQIFAQVSPASAMKVFLRGHIAASVGFGWAPPRQGTWLNMDKFEEGARLIHQTLEQILREISVESTTSIIPVGFSQGGAMALALLYHFPMQYWKAAVLSGFLPKAADSYFPFYQKSIFLSHGVKDKIIPIDMARESVKILNNAGASVYYCESQTAHKTSSECLKQLKIFLEDNLPLSGTDKSN